jgi:hypothetical protein
MRLAAQTYWVPLVRLLLMALAFSLVVLYAAAAH